MSVKTITKTVQAKKLPSAYFQEALERNIKLRKTEPNRLEVIDEKGRKYVRYNCKFELDYQDDGKTLKIFVSER